MSEQHTRGLFPEIEPYNSFHLPCGNVHEIYVEESGNPNGQPILFLHGGPGGGTGQKQRRFFDPNHYRIILFDQRGCGKSRPLGEVKENTTADLIKDIETIRKHLSINRWTIFGGSWGSTLGLVYATQHSKYVIGLILRGVFLSRAKELEWFLNEVNQFFPELHNELTSLRENINKDNLVEIYSQLIFGNNIKVAKEAALSWNKFEGSILKLKPDQNLVSDESIDSDFELARAKVQLHYINSNCFVNGEDILNQSKILKDKPITIVQGRYDMVCPPKTAFELHQKCPHSKLIMVEDAGHSASEQGTLSALIDATNEFKIYS
jgi:proline iminopeptidase